MHEGGFETRPYALTHSCRLARPGWRDKELTFYCSGNANEVFLNT
jgi:hypothetical protein